MYAAVTAAVLRCAVVESTVGVVVVAGNALKLPVTLMVSS